MSLKTAVAAAVDWQTNSKENLQLVVVVVVVVVALEIVSFRRTPMDLGTKHFVVVVVVVVAGVETHPPCSFENRY